MFEVKKSHDAYDIYELSDTSSGSLARVAPERGGLAISFVANGRDVLFLDKDSFVDPSKNVRGGNPILFPICGPLKDNKIAFNGKEYSMKQHGVARLYPWKVASTGTDGAASLVMELASNEETLKVYPWKFRLRFTYELSGTELRLKQEYSNDSDSPMPIHIGFHPYFTVKDKNRLKFNIPASRYQDTTNWTDGQYDGTFDFEKDVIDIVFLDVKGQEASMTDAVDGSKVTVKFDPSFKYVVFWTVKGSDFVCIEPWSGRRFTLNSGEDVLQVAPGTTLKTQIAFEVTPA